MQKIIKQPWFYLLIIVSAVVLFFFRQLKYPAFNLIDDGYSLFIAHELHQDYSLDNWQENLVEKEVAKGRLRPGYYLYYYLVFLAGGEEPLMYWVAQAATLFGVLVLVYYFVKEATDNQKAAIVSALIALLFPSLIENFLRLGPAESRQILWLLLSMFFILKVLKRKTQVFWHSFLAVLFYFWALLTKETSILALPMLLLLPLANWLTSWKKIKKSPRFHQQLGLILTLGLGSAIFLLMLPVGQGYSGGLSFDLTAAKESLFYVRAAFPEFHWLLVAGGLLFVRRLIDNRKGIYLAKNEFLLPLIFFGLAAAYLLFPLFWEHQLERYYFLGDMFVLIFVASEVTYLYAEHLKKKLEHRSLLIVAGLLILITNFAFLPSQLNPSHLITRFHFNRQTWYEQYQYSYALVAYLQNQVKQNSKIFMSFNDYEVIYEVGLYASRFSEREIVVFNENQKASDNFGLPYLYSENVLEGFRNTDEQAILIKRGEPEESSVVLWPADDILRDSNQVWSIVEKDIKE